jgi:serine protease Do
MSRRYVMIIVLIVVINLLRDWYEDTPVPRRPLPEGVPEVSDYGDITGPLPGSSAYDPEISVGLGKKTDSTGTAFAIDESGWWMTARHVVDNCTQVQLRFPGHRGALVDHVVQHSKADLALLRTGTMPHVLPLANERLYISQNGFHIGYPRGRPGEVWSTLLGRRRMRISGRYRTNEPIVAWAERRRRPSNLKNLGGLSGGPALDGAGRVVGVLVAESRRRGRVYTTAPVSMTQILSRSPVASNSENMMSLSPQNLKTRAEMLRREPSIAKVVCLAGSARSRRGYW